MHGKCYYNKPAVMTNTWSKYVVFQQLYMYVWI